MRGMLIAGVLLIVFGVVSLAYQGISYTNKEEVVDIGPLEITTEETERIPLPPILGAVALVGGILLTIAGSRKSALG